MKHFNSFLAFATVAVVAMFSACTGNEPSTNKVSASLVKKAEVQVTSGDVVLAQTPGFGASKAIRRSIASADPTIEQINFHWSNPVDIFEDFPERQTPDGKFGNYLFESNGKPFNLIMLYSNGGYRHFLGIYWYDEDNVKHEMDIWNEFEDEAKGKSVWENYNGLTTNTQISRKADNAGAYTICLPEGTRFGFYQVSLKNTKSHNDTVTEAVRLVQPAGPVVACPYKFYTEQELNWNYSLLQGKPLTSQTMSMQTEADGQTWTIIGMEDISLTYPSCDKDYNDVVFALNPSPKMYVDNGGGEWVPVTPAAKDTIEGSVEVNLSINDPHDNGDYIASKLSIHVRAITDVEVVLPVEKKFYCEADDMDISMSHKELEIVYNIEPQVVEMQIGETVVTLTVTYEDDAIRVTTDGINDEVIAYCAEHYADGITFEVWNYYKDVTRDELKSMLDLSTVDFLDNLPMRYINAFGRIDGQQTPNDCVVTPLEDVFTILPADPEANNFNVIYAL